MKWGSAGSRAQPVGGNWVTPVSSLDPTKGPVSSGCGVSARRGRDLCTLPSLGTPDVRAGGAHTDGRSSDSWAAGRTRTYWPSLPRLTPSAV
ncbi:hypothetical protein GCM10010174_40030 [Kutzneria viridogrisea]